MNKFILFVIILFTACGQFLDPAILNDDDSSEKDTDALYGVWIGSSGRGLEFVDTGLVYDLECTNENEIARILDSSKIFTIEENEIVVEGISNKLIWSISGDTLTIEITDTEGATKTFTYTKGAIGQACTPESDNID